jgi:hypothetical protein
VALGAVLERLAVARGVKMPVEIDRVDCNAAGRSIPMVDMTARAGRLPRRSPAEVGTVALGAVLERLAVARGVEISAEIDRVRDHPAGRFVPVIGVA